METVVFRGKIFLMSDYLSAGMAGNRTISKNNRAACIDSL
jgi:hypothetical protein